MSVNQALFDWYTRSVNIDIPTPIHTHARAPARVCSFAHVHNSRVILCSKPNQTLRYMPQGGSTHTIEPHIVPLSLQFTASPKPNKLNKRTNKKYRLFFFVTYSLSAHTSQQHKERTQKTKAPKIELALTLTFCIGSLNTYTYSCMCLCVQEMEKARTKCIILSREKKEQRQQQPTQPHLHK